MAQDKNEVLDEEFDDIKESDDTDWKAEAIKLREKAIRQREKTKELRDSLKERETKLAEFEKQQQLSEKAEKKPNEFGLLEKTFLAAKGITADDEVELVKKWMADTGKSVDYVADHAFVKAELETMRTSKANLDATSNIQGESNQSGVKNTPDYWITKATKGADGNLMFPEETPKELYPGIVEKLSGGKEGVSGKLGFYNSK